MKILENVKKIPGGLMVIPLLLGTIINTFFGHSILGMTETGIWDYFSGTFTVNLFQAGAMPLLAAFLFCNGTTIDFKKAGQPVYKGVILIITKVGIGIAIGLLVNKFIGPAGILGLTPLAIIGALSNSNGGLYAALAGEYGDATDVSACAILALKDGPFFTMLALGAAAVAAIDSTLLAISATATAQITAAIIVTTLLCPVLTTFLHKHEERKKCPNPSINPTT